MIGSLAGISLLLLAVTQSTPPEISVEEHRARRQAVREAIGKDSLFLLRAPEAGHGVGEFRQDNNFYYLTGVEDPGLVLLIDGGRKDGEILFLPERNPGRERWNGPRLYPGEEAQAATGLAATAPLSDFERTLERKARGRKNLYYNYERVSLDEKLSGDLELIRKLQDRAVLFGNDPMKLEHVRKILAGLRQVKSDAEMARLREAIEITCDGLRAAMEAVEPGLYEYELQSVLEYVFKRRGAKRTGFSSIVGSGPNSCILHYRDNVRKIEAGDLVVIDVGAEFGYYTADVTRTIPVSGKFTERQREIYEIVWKAQEAAIQMVKPGSTMGEVHKTARKYIDDAGYGKYFIHGTSHWLGLGVHDVGERNRKLEPGMVLTVEPGIYLPDEEIGVRIEDDVLVTEEGHLLLSASLPRDPDAIEKIIAGGAREGLPRVHTSPPGSDY